MVIKYGILNLLLYSAPEVLLRFSSLSNYLKWETKGNLSFWFAAFLCRLAADDDPVVRCLGISFLCSALSTA